MIRDLRFCAAKIGGIKIYTKGVFSSENSSASTGKKEVWCIPKKLVFKGKRKENTYTPKSLQGACGGPLRAVLVYRFWPPIRFRMTLQSDYMISAELIRESLVLDLSGMFEALQLHL